MQTTKQKAEWAWALVNHYFNDINKTNEWFYTENPGLGGVKPAVMIANGKIDNLLKFIESSREEDRL